MDFGFAAFFGATRGGFLFLPLFLFDTATFLAKALGFVLRAFFAVFNTAGLPAFTVVFLVADLVVAPFGCDDALLVVAFGAANETTWAFSVFFSVSVVDTGSLGTTSAAL